MASRLRRASGGVGAADAFDGRAALADGSVKQAFCRGHRHQGGHFSAAAGLPEDRDIARIAAEIGDVIPHPFERQHDIAMPGVAGIGIFRAADIGEIKIAENIEPMVDRDHNDVAFARHVRAVVNGVVARAG